MKNNFETVFLLRVYLLKLKHQKRLWKSCIEEAYTLTKKGNAFADIFQQISLDFKQFLMVFFNSKKSCLTEIIQMTYLVIHEISCRYFFNGLSVHRGYNYLPKWNFSLTPEPFEVLKWDFLKSIITSKPHPSIAFANAQMTYLRLLCSLD